ncbi:hypothetical protein BLA29_015389 [Euroglyphus maynei]|uniref:Uncharacterized protein n=1 Tax=Euroglyphus maynei TaxID=6958 RepID=A0A1Y3AWK2_EURMA|nr:hypothetical protein BLA29_015389 [Euroglyphus maynei]
MNDENIWMNYVVNHSN